MNANDQSLPASMTAVEDSDGNSLVRPRGSGSRNVPTRRYRVGNCFMITLTAHSQPVCTTIVVHDGADGAAATCEPVICAACFGEDCTDEICTEVLREFAEEMAAEEMAQRVRLYL